MRAGKTWWFITSILLIVWGTAQGSPYYEALVGQKNYLGAIHFVCTKYQLPCHLAYYKIVPDAPEHTYGETTLGKTILLSTASFHYSSLNKPHEGWLAAIIGHELIHVQQGTFRRVYDRLEQIYGGNNYYVASQELEAWSYMAENARRFNLTWYMVADIDRQIEEYSWVMSHNGEKIEGGLPINAERMAVLYRQWKSWYKEEP